MLMHLLSLIVRAHTMWPAYPLPVVARACLEAVLVETSEVDAEQLLAIAEHESNLEPDAVSYVTHDWNGRHRTDLLLRNSDVRLLPDHVVYGYLSAMGLRDQIVNSIRHDGGMQRGADELAEWATTCRHMGAGSIAACTLRGHAGGTACAKDEATCTPDQATFARIFLARASALRQVGTRLPIPKA
jgi:hypothetical protein